MPATVNPVEYILGAAEVYYRTVGSVAAWTSVGATTGDVVFRVTQSFINPGTDINGILGPIQLMDYKSNQGAEVEFTMLQIAGSKLALAVPGATSTTLATTDAGGTPFSSTLAAAAAIGDTNVKVVAITNAAAGDYVRINVAGALAEYRVIDVVGTAGAGGTGLQFRDPLLKVHASGVAAVEAVGDGKTEIVPSTVRRQPAAAYNDFALVAQSPADYYELLLYRAISQTDSAELTFGNESLGGIRVTIASRLDGSNLALPPFKLRVPAA